MWNGEYAISQFYNEKIFYLWPSVVQIVTPHKSGLNLANCGIYDATC